MLANVSPKAVWRAHREDPDGVLGCVRIVPDWGLVGISDLRETAKQLELVPRRTYPSMLHNSHFLRQRKEPGMSLANHVFLICRAGGASRGRRRQSPAIRIWPPRHSVIATLAHLCCGAV